MLHYAVALFLFGLVAALTGFVGIATVAVDLADLLFVLFAVLVVGNFIVCLRRQSQAFPDR